MRHDVTFPLFVEVDEIYNLACPASPIHYQHDPVQTTKTSVHGAINMLGLAKRLGCKILQASTSEVYGDPSVHPQSEDYWGHVNPIGPRSCYDEGKRCAETLFFDYHRQNKAADQGRADLQHLWPAHASGRRPRRLQLHHAGAARTSRSPFTATAARPAPSATSTTSSRGLIALMETGPDITGPINIGNPNEFTVRELAEKVIELTGSNSRRSSRSRCRRTIPKQRQPDISQGEARTWAGSRRSSSSRGW